MGVGWVVIMRHPSHSGISKAPSFIDIVSNELYPGISFPCWGLQTSKPKFFLPSQCFSITKINKGINMKEKKLCIQFVYEIRHISFTSGKNTSRGIESCCIQSIYTELR